MSAASGRRSERNETVPSPAGLEQPRASAGEGIGTPGILLDADAPTVEPARGGQWIDGAGEVNAVPARILQHVRERVPDFAWRLQRMDVVAILEQRAPTPPRAIQPARQAHGQPLHPAREIARAENIPLYSLIERIETDRTSRNRSSSIRLFVLGHFRGGGNRTAE